MTITFLRRVSEVTGAAASWSHKRPVAGRLGPYSSRSCARSPRRVITRIPIIISPTSRLTAFETAWIRRSFRGRRRLAGRNDHRLPPRPISPWGDGRRGCCGLPDALPRTGRRSPSGNGVRATEQAVTETAAMPAASVARRTVACGPVSPIQRIPSRTRTTLAPSQRDAALARSHAERAATVRLT